MAVIDQAAIRELAALKGERAPITSCYLDVDGRRLARYQDLEHEVELLVKRAKARSDGHQSVDVDLRNIEQFVRDGIDRSRTRGVAIFACAEQDLWEVIQLPVPVTPQVAVHETPAIGQLEVVAQRNETIGVLVVDRQRARLFICALGDLLDHSEIFDALPRDEGTRGERDRGGDHPEHLQEAVQHHVRRATQAMFELWQRHGFAHLALAAPAPLTREVEAQLHPYLRERLAGRLDVTPAAGDEEVLARTLDLESDIEQRRQQSEVDRLRGAVASGRRGVSGLEDVLSALAEHRAAELLVSHGYAAPGWRCGSCGLLATVGRTCKRCGSEMVELEDVVEEATQEALSQSCRVEVCVGNADLDVMGRIGALLRF